MRRAFVVLASILAVRATLVAAPGDCKPASGEYQGYLVKRVGIKTPLEFPVGWINRLLLGPAIASLRPLAGDVPVKANDRFDFSKHLQAMQRIRDLYGTLRPGERLKIALVVPRLS